MLERVLMGAEEQKKLYRLRVVGWRSRELWVKAEHRGRNIRGVPREERGIRTSLAEGRFSQRPKRYLLLTLSAVVLRNVTLCAGWC